MDLWIGEAEFLGKGIGRAMMQQALHLCFVEPEVHTVLVDPLADNSPARRFYERCGFVFVENRVFGSVDGSVFRKRRS